MTSDRLRVMSFIIAFVTALATAFGATRRDESDALRQTAPSYLGNPGEAARHLGAATFAGEAFSVDPALLLSIAWHESRYAIDARTREPGGRWSCGVMTPVPHVGRCAPEELTAVGGYLNGARHLRWWLRACRRDLTCTLRGYAGGFRLIERCRADGAYFVRDGVDACDIRAMFTNRASWIRARLRRAAKGVSS